MIPGLLPLLMKPTNNDSDPLEVGQDGQWPLPSGSTTVLDLASDFQKTASSSRLGNKLKTGFSLSQHGNIKKAQLNGGRRKKTTCNKKVRTVQKSLLPSGLHLPTGICDDTTNRQYHGRR